MKDKTIVAYIFSLISVGFGWFLNEISYWFRVRKEDKGKLKEVLYNLLETFHLFIVSNVEVYVDIVSKKIIEKFPPKGQSEEVVNQFLNQFILNLFEKYFKSILFDRLDEIKKNYQLSVNSLARIDPILAYKVSGRTIIVECFNKLEEWIGDINKSFSEGNKEISNGNEFLIPKIKSILIPEALKVLEDDICKVALKINPVVWYKSKQSIKNAKERNLKDALEKIDEFLGNLKI